MTSTTIAIALGAAAMAATLAAPPARQGVTLPPETAAFEKSDLPGYALVQRNCLMCHSAQYVSSQPPGLSRAYWEATVKKMKTPFGAPYPEADAPAMVDYLVRTYGSERQDSR